MKKMKLALITILFLIQFVNCFDDSIKECWNIRLQNEKLFCYPGDLIQWPLSKSVYYDQDRRDAGKLTFFTFVVARANYNIVRDKWKGEKNLTAPNNHCLAIARYFYCAQAFPACKDQDNQEMGICSYVCQMWAMRCPHED